MRHFTITPAIFELFPDARIGIIVCRGLDNTGESSADIMADLNAATEESARHVPLDEFAQNDVIRTWRQAFQKFPGKKGARSSIEAMLKRAKQGKGVGSINPLVDLYNTVSLRHGVPVGGEDLDAIEGDVRLTLAAGGEDFVTYGSDVSEPPVAGEVIYADDVGAICRNWNWREAVRTMLTEKTTNAVMVIEAVDAAGAESVEAATNALADAIQRHLGGTTRVAILDREHPSADLDAKAGAFVGVNIDHHRE